MAGYEDGAYASDGYAGYGSYYSVYYPNDDLDASAGLDGPGSHYDLSVSANGAVYTSYAYESYRGGVFEQNTMTNSRFIDVRTTYSYGDDSYHYSHSSTAYTPLSPASSGYGFGYGSGMPDHYVSYGYSSVTSTREQSGDITAFEDRFFSFTSFTDGSSVSHYTDLTQDQSGGQVVPGSSSSYNVSGYDYGGGYTDYIHR